MLVRLMKEQRARRSVRRAERPYVSSLSMIVCFKRTNSTQSPRFHSREYLHDHSSWFRMEVPRRSFSGICLLGIQRRNPISEIVDKLVSMPDPVLFDHA